MFLYGLTASAHGQAEYETNAEADSDSGKRVTLNCIAGFLDRVGRHVLSAFVLAARHVAYAVTQILRMRVIHLRVIGESRRRARVSRRLGDVWIS